MAHQYYGQQQGGYPPPPGPPGGSPYPPQQAPYGAPPQHGYPPPHGPPGGSPYPPHQQGGYPPPGGPSPGQYGAPPGQYGQQPGYGQQQGYGQPPPANHGYYGGPPPPGAPGGPPMGGHGGPPPMGGGYPSQPSPGYVPGQTAPMDCSREADEARAAMKGFGTDEKRLIAVMARLDPLQVNSVKAAFKQRHRRDLISDLTSETSGYFKDGLVAIARGPLAQDVFNLDKAISGLGTKENVLNDVLLGRSNADINAIKQAYQQTYRRSLESDVKGDLSMKTERLFTMVLSARRNEESTPVIPQQTDQDVQELYRATEGKSGTDQITVCSIISSKSDGQLRAIAHAYKAKYHRSLEEVLKKEFSGHMEDALLFMLNSAVDKAKHDADLLEDTMKGMGTKDDLLVNRLVRIHWDRQRMSQAKAAYKHFYKQDLVRRIEGETRGDYERLMVALVNSA
ncbi:annexin-like protein 2 [Elsinoe australis]|uniref:Annexin n=1 Tax=Elsinoe australis TaxID=40998 RepID=A0A4U7ARU2_9PEZI|nr:annexin-like protein 2 [Elsinoe australis]